MPHLAAILIRPRPMNQTRGIVVANGRSFPCALGRSGIQRDKKEGDGATPLVTTRPLYGFYRADREAKPLTRLPFRALRKEMGWCDAPAHPSYNHLVRLPFSASHEEMWRQDALYDLVLVLDINITQRIRGKGSALFMHVARPGYLPTEGCIALSKPHFRQLLKGLTPDTHIEIGR